ncbi:MAG: T9SS type A sorting domain-containing protein [Paludibacter sp.]|nr:T9SS type A sorting domain-containing protein [Paludibacter sp.]
MKKILLLSAAFLFVFQLTAKNLFVATNGNDLTGDGTIENPYASVMKAHQSVVAGDTVFIRGGTYMMQESDIALKSSIFAYVFTLDKSGTSTKRICYWAYKDEKPIFDLSNVKPADYRVYVFYVKGSYIHLKGLEVIGTQVTILTHTQSECFHNEGSNNIYEQLSMHDGMAIGFYLTRGANNLVLNCDAYNNWDNVSENMKGGNTDGFGFHGNNGATGNVMRGCRAWFNSDDGYDCISNSESVTFENCWAFYNGYSTTFTSLGDGNGFKAGGYGQAPAVSSLPNPIPSNNIRFCMAYRNKANGFYANHHVVTGNKWYNNTAYRNGTNYNMLSQEITKSTITGNDTTIDCPGINHLLRNNLSFRYSTQTETNNMGTSDIAFNSFSPNSGVVVNSADFLSTNESLLIAPREADGSLPDIDFLKLVQTSDLIDKGTDIGFAFYGVAPDFGASESNYITGFESIVENKQVLYPNPVMDNLHVKLNDFDKLEIYDNQGKMIHSTKFVTQFNVSDLKPGIYFVRIRLNNNSIIFQKLIKQ